MSATYLERLDRDAQRFASRKHRFVITSRVTFDGYKVWGFQLPSGFRQLPNWHRRKDAVSSAIWHLERGR
jgi:hypothetical protein